MEQPHNQQESGDLARIAQGIAAAELADRNIDDATARLIASQLHGGQSSALYSLASCGAVDYRDLRIELLADYDRSPDDVRRMIDHLGTYVIEHDGRGSVEGWFRITEDS